MLSFVVSFILVLVSWPGQSSGQRVVKERDSPVLAGTWIATAGPTQVFRGAWSGQTSPQTPNTALGSWALFNEASEIVLEGTWSMRKTGQGWQGSWTARTSKGQSFSGTWGADLANFSGKTIEQMLESTVEKQVAGSWISGRRQGNWWLKGSRQRGHK
jgi:hypothetical protein